MGIIPSELPQPSSIMVDGVKITRKEIEERMATDMFGATPEEVVEELRAEGVYKTRIRVKSTVRVVSASWVEVTLQIRLDEEMPWLDVLDPNRPLLVSRGSDSEVIVGSVVGRFLTIDGNLRHHMSLWDERIGRGVMEYRAWLKCWSSAGVAVRTRPDGMLNLYGL